MSQELSLETHQRWFWFGCLFELGLVGIAALLSEWFHQPLLDDLRWRAKDAVLGALAAVPAVLLFVGILKSEDFSPRRASFWRKRCARSSRNGRSGNWL